MGLKDLHVQPGDDGAPHPPDEFLGFSAEHDARDDFYPSGTCAMDHGFS
jgi:hypothetical protein